MGDLEYKIGISSLCPRATGLIRELTGRLGSEKAFFEATEKELEAATGYRNRIFSRDVRDRALQEAGDELLFVESHGIKPLYFEDDAYPHRLAETPDAPVILYGLGNCDLNASPVIAVVGTRHATSYGVDLVGKIIDGLAQQLTARPVVVSGLAFGIDIAAHRAALSAGLPTVAVFAHGLNTVYPAQHRSDAVEICRSEGMLLTEYRSSDVTHKGNFLARNRIVAGMADCLLIAESAERGGAIVTAKLAGEYDREVFAIPGRTTDRYSAGCNRLIARNQARLVTAADDIIDAMGWTRRETVPTQKELFEPLSPLEQAVVDLLTNRGDLRLEEITAALDVATPKLMGTLIDMEFRGLVAPIPGGRYRVG